MTEPSDDSSGSPVVDVVAMGWVQSARVIGRDLGVYILPAVVLTPLISLRLVTRYGVTAPIAILVGIVVVVLGVSLNFLFRWSAVSEARKHSKESGANWIVSGYLPKAGLGPRVAARLPRGQFGVRLHVFLDEHGRTQAVPIGSRGAHPRMAGPEVGGPSEPSRSVGEVFVDPTGRPRRAVLRTETGETATLKGAFGPPFRSDAGRAALL